jgi:hypothetical protein
MKRIEISLSLAEHAHLIEASCHDRKFRSLQAFARDCLLKGLNSEAEHLGIRRKQATSALVTAGNQRRKP